MSKSYLYTYILTLIGGIALIVLHGSVNLFEAIVIIIGILFLVPGLITLIKVLFPSKTAKATGSNPGGAAAVLASAASIFGILLIVQPHLFTNFLVYAFGILLILCGIGQLMNFGPSMKELSFPWYFMATPILCIGIGAVIIVLGAENIMSVLSLVTGIVLTVYGINGLIGYTDRYKRIKHGGATGNIVDIE